MTGTRVGATIAFPAKRAILDRLRGETDGGLLSGWDVDYAFNGGARERCIYGGGWRILSQDQGVAEDPGLVVLETVEIGFYFRVKASPPVDVADTDAVVDDASGIVARILSHNPKLGGDMTWMGIARGQGDYSQTNLETISVASFALQVQGYLSWRPE